MPTHEVQLAERQRLLARYKVVASREIPPRATEEHLKLVARILAAFEGQAQRPQGLLAAVAEFTRCYEQYADQLPTEIASVRGKLRVVCEAGCHHCCQSPVTVIASEALTIAEYIRARFSAAQLTALAARLGAYRMAADPMGSPASLCPLNEDGLCSVYEVRPFNCRKFHSLDLRACERFFRDRIEPHARLEEPNRADRFGFFSRSAEVAFAALGVEPGDLDFIPALLIALGEPDAAARLLDGEDIFLRAVRPDP